jgi:predicted amidophosphoribosyltransferase
MPSSRSSVRRRGDDVVLALARTAASRLRLAGHHVRVAPLLEHTRAVQDSAGLSAAAREANLAGAMRLRRPAGPSLRGLTVVLVDDLLTTGATLVEAARVLRAAGAIVPSAAAVAATARHRGEPAGTLR